MPGLIEKPLFLLHMGYISNQVKWKAEETEIMLCLFTRKTIIIISKKMKLPKIENIISVSLLLILCVDGSQYLEQISWHFSSDVNLLRNMFSATTICVCCLSCSLLVAVS